MITKERLVELLNYNPGTGEFTNKVRRSNAMEGAVAGHVGPNGYRTIMIDYKSYYAHHLAVLFMTGSMPPKKSHVDHRDGNKDGNRWENLRVTTPVVNGHNRHKINKNNTTGAAGVSRLGNRFIAQISVNRKFTKIGVFDTIPEAAAAREAFRAKLHL